MNYRSLRTLGFKSKLFEWTFDSKNGLEIVRQFSSGPRVDTFSIDEIEQIIKFVTSNENIPLANNVEKIHNGTEKNGLGSFIFNHLKKDLNKAQAASQLAAIFVTAGIFSYNKTSRNMKFWIKNRDWKFLLNNVPE